MSNENRSEVKRSLKGMFLGKTSGIYGEGG